MTLVLVTGARTWTDRNAVSRALIHAQGGTPPAEMALLHGACPIRPHPVTRAPASADMLADAAAHRLGWADIRRRPANWSALGRRAGFIRNGQMVTEARAALYRGADVQCIGFCVPCSDPSCRRPEPHPSHGTEHCLQLAADAGIPVRTVRDGTWENAAAG
jgi:hypothetical protein